MNRKSNSSVTTAVVLMCVIFAEGTVARLLGSQVPEYVSQNTSEKFNRTIQSAHPVQLSYGNQEDVNISQFGAYYEWQPQSQKQNPKLMLELLPLFAGNTYGKLKASALLALGINLPNGIGFGRQPNRFYTKMMLALGTHIYKGIICNLGPRMLYGGTSVIETGLTVEACKCFNIGNTNLPIKLIYTMYEKENRLSLIFGYAINL
jgi:hypothetical protein